MLRKFNEAMAKREGGFTLIELLVVMIIIGILAAVAISIFMNQQKTSRDTATTSDVKNIATNVQSALVQYPDATYFAVSDSATAPATGGTAAAPVAATDTNGDGKINLFVGTGAAAGANEVVSVSLTGGTNVNIGRGATNGTFVVKGWNASGKNFTTATGTTNLTYDSEAGGLKK